MRAMWRDGRAGLVAPVLAMMVVLLVGCHPVASVTPSFSVGVDSYPTRPGSCSVLRYREISKGKPEVTWTEETTLQRATNDLLEYSVRTMKGSQVQKARFFVVMRDNALYYHPGDEAPKLEITDAMKSPAGGSAASAASHSVAGGILLFRFPLVPELMWEFQHPTEGLASRRVVSKEFVEVPAGRYEAVKIEERRDSGAGTSWYVVGMGVVKSDLSSSAMRRVKELVKFEVVPPK